MDEQAEIFTIHNFTVNIVLDETKKSLLRHTSNDFFNLYFFDMCIDDLIDHVKKNVYQNIQVYFDAFGCIPDNGTFMFNDLNAPIYIMTKSVKGSTYCSPHLTVICQLIEEEEETPTIGNISNAYALQFQN